MSEPPSTPFYRTAAARATARPAAQLSGPSGPLTRAIILRNAPAAAASAATPQPSNGTVSVASASTLSSVQRLDLGLERLHSLAGLDVLCPELRYLSANVNQLSTLEGLSGLSALRELSLKDNAIAALPKGALPGAGALRRLALDCNRLEGQLAGLEACRCAGRRHPLNNGRQGLTLCRMAPQNCCSAAAFSRSGCPCGRLRYAHRASVVTPQRPPFSPGPCAC